jgi:hypothetical protein
VKIPRRPGAPRALPGTILLIGVLIGGGAAPAAAGNISLELTTSAGVQDGTLTVKLTVRNTGDEAAHSVIPLLRFRDETAHGEVRADLQPRQSMDATLTLPVGDLAIGRWPYRIMVGYADANAYPLHALHAGTVTVGSPPPGTLGVVQATADPLATAGAMRVRVKNLSASPRQVLVRVYLPDGIEAPEADPTVALGGWEERDVVVSLVNRAALPGSRYAIFASAEYDDGALHQSVVVPTSLEIVAAQSVFQRHRTTLWILAAVVVLGWAGAAVWWLVAGRRSAARG